MDASVEIVKHLLASVVYIHAEVPSSHPSTRILGDERMGSGTVVDPAGLILPVNYVVMGAETLQVTLGRGRALKAEIVAQDFEIGLALLRVKRQGLQAVPIGDSETLTRGEPVFAIGSNGPRERRVAGGLLTHLRGFAEYWEDLLQPGIVSSASHPGFRGGPLFTLRRRIVRVRSPELNRIERCSVC